MQAMTDLNDPKADTKVETAEGTKAVVLKDDELVEVTKAVVLITTETAEVTKAVVPIVDKAVAVTKAVDDQKVETAEVSPVETSVFSETKYQINVNRSTSRERDREDMFSFPSLSGAVWTEGKENISSRGSEQMELSEFGIIP